jgi:hypothetical protein
VWIWMGDPAKAEVDPGFETSGVVGALAVPS